MIKITGENAEEILNVTAKNKINIWGLYCKKQCIIGCIGFADFKHLRIVKRGKKFRVNIVKKCGLPFKTKLYNRRIGLIIGAVIFSLILYFLSTHIWLVSVEGNKNISKKEIIKSCEDIGIKEGIKASRISPQNDSQRLILKRNDIAWASLNIEGCCLTVNITEIDKDTTENKEIPTNIKASMDGIIKKIDVTSGNVIVKTDDVVKKGDVLVSGIIEQLSSTIFVHSSGKIIAETERTIEKSGKYVEKYSGINGKAKKKTYITFFGTNIPLYLGEEKRESKLTVSKKILNLFNKKMPLSFTTLNYKFLETKTREYNKDELIDVLTKDIEQEISNLLLESYIEKETVVTENEDGIKVSKTIICRENIAYQDEIIIAPVN